MLLKVNGQYLDFNEDIEIEKQSRVFEDISENQYDFSYSFELPPTSKNLKILGFPFNNVSSKAIYKNVYCDIIDNDGITIYKGNLRVERKSDKILDASFFSGNYNWMASINGVVSDLDFSSYDIDLTRVNIVSSWLNESGLTFPLIDIGGLITRSYKDLTLRDFNGCMYVKTIFHKIFFSEGIKIKGDLINDWVFNNLIVCKNNRNNTQINSRSSHVHKTTDQSIGVGVPEKVEWDDDSNFPYFDGDQNNFSLVNHRYTADVKMYVEIQVTTTATSGDYLAVYLYKNGSFDQTLTNEIGGTNSRTVKNYLLNAGDYVEVWAESNSTPEDITEAKIKITPQFLYRIFGASTVPNWTKVDFVSNILNMFNVVSEYNPFTKELTLDFFDKIRNKDSIDLTKYVKVVDTDFEAFVSDFGRKNIFKYQQGDDEEIRDYNVTKFIKYADGEINIDNDFISDKVDIIELDFKSPISYINGPLDASIERVNLVELEELDSTSITSITDASGIARVNISSDMFIVGDLVRISDSTNPSYNGDWIVDVQASGYVQFKGMNYNGSAVGDISKINYSYSNNDDVFIFINIPSIDVTEISSISSFFVDDVACTDPAYAYFNLLNNGKNVNEYFKQSLCFGSVENPLFYQKTLLDTYWRNFNRVLSDPVQLKTEAHLPKSIFLKLKSNKPIYINTEKASGLFYRNRVTGYKGSHLPCEVELIKL